MTKPNIQGLNNRALERQSWIGSALGLVADAFRFVQRMFGPLLDLAIRLWIAQIFFVSGVLKIANLENALYLSRYEYPVSWMDPVTAAYVGVAIELMGAILLTIGLATRFAALSMAILALVVQFNYQGLDQHLFWTALLGWFVVFGAGPLSLDRSLARGLADTALPFAASGVRGLAWLSKHIGPLYQLLLRVWLSVSILIAGGAVSLPGVHTQLLPLKSAAHLTTGIELLLAVLLLLGLGTRFSAGLLILFTAALQMMDLRYTEYSYWLFAFGLLALFGAGRWSVDALIAQRLKRRFPQLEGKPAFALTGLPRVVIVGAGFGGISCAARLARTPVQITLIDRNNYHLFQPLLYQVATTALSPGDIAMPIRGLFREQFNTRVVLGTVTGVDTEGRHVLVGEQRIPYDYLVLATGAAHSYFGKDEWAPYAPGLKRVEDATQVRARLLSAFERAEATEDAQERIASLTFLIVGGGPTGVELAGAIAELARYGMEKEFRSFDPSEARVVLVQAGPRLLPTFPEQLSAATQRALEKLGVEVLLNSKVERIDAQGVEVSGKRLAARTVLWAAGVIASPAANWLNAERDNANRVKVNTDLSVPHYPNIFVIGDTALSNGWNGKPVPGLAPAAKQGGVYVAKVIRARVDGRRHPGPFKYAHLGSLATIGRRAAVADFGFVRLRGSFAWWLWGAIHIGFLVGMRNRVSVLFDWLWAYLTYRSGTRLITGNPQQETQNLAQTAPHSNEGGNTEDLAKMSRPQAATITTSA
jgi:putative oxidoreductase